jgi:hypothetical protein
MGQGKKLIFPTHSDTGKKNFIKKSQKQVLSNPLSLRKQTRKADKEPETVKPKN